MTWLPTFDQVVAMMAGVAGTAFGYEVFLRRTMRRFLRLVGKVRDKRLALQRRSAHLDWWGETLCRVDAMFRERQIEHERRQRQQQNQQQQPPVGVVIYASPLHPYHHRRCMN